MHFYLQWTQETEGMGWVLNIVFLFCIIHVIIYAVYLQVIAECFNLAIATCSAL